MSPGTTVTERKRMSATAKLSPPATARILVVEDESKLRESLAEGLRMEEWQVTTAENAANALTLLSEGTFDLLLLDRNLPDEDGIEILRRIRAEGTQIPVIVMTARTSQREQTEALQRGATAYVTKPFAFDDLLARCRALLTPA